MVPTGLVLVLDERDLEKIVKSWNRGSRESVQSESREVVRL